MSLELYATLSLSVSIVLGFGLLHYVLWWRGESRLSATQALWCQYLWLGACLAGFAAMPLPITSVNFLAEHVAIVDSNWTMPLRAAWHDGNILAQAYGAHDLLGQTIAEDPVSYFVLVFLLFGSLFFAALDFESYGRLSRICRKALLMRAHGRVRLVVSKDVMSAFSWRSLTRCWIVIPESYLKDGALLRVAVAHELQHHRQFDTVMSYADRILLYAFWWNPIVHFWLSAVYEMREFRCDEALAGKKVAVKDYCEGLLQAAERCRSRTPLPSVGLARKPGSFMTRRIEKMVQGYNSSSPFRLLLPLTIACFVAFFAGFARANLDTTRALSEKSAQELVQTINLDSGLELQTTDTVMEYVNKYLASEDGRAFLEELLAQFAKVKPLIIKQLEAHDLPKELVAVAMIESGFKNPPQSVNPQYSAGMWQFIPATARRYDLRVNDKIDERLNLDLSTNAALRYLKTLHAQFRSWPLAILSYNAGEGKIKRGIEHTGSRDPWTIVERGFGGDKDYLAKFMAAVIVLHQQKAI